MNGCRKRNLPASFRFLSPKVYVATVVIPLTVLQQGRTAARLQRLAAETVVHHGTLLRWRRWWRGTFQESRFWRAPGRRSCRPPTFCRFRFPAILR